MKWAIAADNTVVVARFCVKKRQKGQMKEKMAELCGETLWLCGENKLDFVTDSS